MQKHYIFILHTSAGTTDAEDLCSHIKTRFKLWFKVKTLVALIHQDPIRLLSEPGRLRRSIPVKAEKSEAGGREARAGRRIIPDQVALMLGRGGR